MERFQRHLGIQETDEPSSDRLICGGASFMRRLFTFWGEILAALDYSEDSQLFTRVLFSAVSKS